MTYMYLYLVEFRVIVSKSFFFVLLNKFDVSQGK